MPSVYIFRIFRRTFIPAASAIVAVAACSPDLADPATGRAAPSANHAASAADASPRFISNRVKYRDAGARPASGRSGSSTLEARALLGIDGVTLLEVTTGSLDDGSAPNALKHVQVKTFDAAGKALRTQNYTQLPGGGTAAFPYAVLARGQKLQVQANISEAKRTAVVTVTETVRLRPDLRVQLNTAAEATMDVPVTLLATVSEGNGDVGARTDCVLYVDGAEADRARGIWVDAGDAVSCAFLHTFTSAGDHALRVAAERVNPGDFDPSNNEAEGTIRVVGRNDVRLSYSAFAEDYREVSAQLDSITYAYDDGRRTLTAQSLTQTTASQTGQITGSTPHGVTIAGTRVNVSQSTNGAVVHSAAWQNAPGDGAGPGNLGCMSRLMDGASFYLCTSGTPASGFTSFQYLRTGKAITYYGVTHTSYWYPDAPENAYTYSTESTVTDASGQPQITIGPDYWFVVELTDAGRTYRADATVVLSAPQTSTSTFYRPSGRRCTSQRNDEFSMRVDICRYQQAVITKRNGNASYTAE